MIITITSGILQAELIGTIINSIVDATAETLFVRTEASYCKASPTISSSKT